MLAVNTSRHEDTNTHHNNTGMDIHNIDMDMHNRDMGIHNIDTDMHNTDMKRDRRNKAVVVLGRQHIRKENSAGVASQLFSSLAISLVL